MFKQIGLYIFFCLIISLSSLILFSLASHFHLALGHDFMDIGDWIADYIWKLTCLSKFLGLFFLFVILNIQSDKRNPFKTFLFNSGGRHSKDIYVVIVFFFLSIFFISNPILTKNEHFSFFSLLTSFVGTYVFYMTDIFVIGPIYTIYSEKHRYRYDVMFAFSLVFYIFNKEAFFFSRNLDITAFFNMFMLLFLLQWGKNTWKAPSNFCLLFLCPLSVLFGTDPMWETRYSPFQLSTPLRPVSYAAITFLCLIYLHRKSKAV